MCNEGKQKKTRERENVIKTRKHKNKAVVLIELKHQNANGIMIVAIDCNLFPYGVREK